MPALLRAPPTLNVCHARRYSVERRAPPTYEKLRTRMHIVQEDAWVEEKLTTYPSGTTMTLDMAWDKAVGWWRTSCRAAKVLYVSYSIYHKSCRCSMVRGRVPARIRGC